MTSIKNVRIGDFCETGSGSTPSRDQMARYYDGGTIPWVKSGELRESIINATEEHITEAALRETSVKLVPANALLVAMYGATVGRLGILGMQATTNQAVCHIVPDPNQADVTYLFRALETKVGEMLSRTVGGAQPNINQGIVKDLRVPLPPLEEQRHIAAILDQAETLRTQRRTALALLDSLTQSLFLDMFGDPATNSRKWPVKRLKDLGQVITGGTPPSSKEGMFDGPIPFITPGDLESEEPVRRSVTEAGAKEVNVVRAGATLVCCIGATIGKVGIAQKDSAFNQQLNAVVWGNHISDNYGYEVMRFFKPTIISWGASTTLPILKKSSFEQIEIPVPPVPLQELFTDRLKHISNLKGLHKSALLGFDNLFNALQSRAFAGEP